MSFLELIQPANSILFISVAAFVIAAVLGLFIVLRADINNRDLIAKSTAYQPLKRIQEEAAAAEAQLGARRQEINAVELQLTDLRREKAEIERESLDASHWTEMARKARQDYDSLADKIAEVDKIRDQFEEATADLEARRSEVADAQQKRDRLTAEIGDIGEKEEEAKRLDKLIEDRQASLENLRGEINQAEDLRERLSQARFEVDQLARSKAALEADCASLTGDVESLRNQLREITEQVEKTENVLDELNWAKSELESLRTTIASHTAQEESLKREIERLEAQAAKTGGVAAPSSAETTAQDIQKAVEDLKRPPSCLFSDETLILLERSAVSDEMEALENTSEYLKDIGLEFENDLLLQFHTSLKIGQISPLTVLAGISGTGKSQLPQRYAEAMGIPFLKVPVQPRWDSPQDLLGFYNYLEQRYSATELVRALLHMDTNPVKHPFDYQRTDDRLLMVLLDEMNLARVEYYFSEFLSRLEGRPSALTTDAELLRASRIEIEIPGNNTDPVSIYPGHNLLFVGTMNEDESTQALSDKVMDRANIIRFPKPASLKGKEGNSSSPAPSEYFLPFNVWQTWQRSPNEILGHQSDDIQSIIDELNGHLEEIRRPFGHRINQAVFTYIANHPRMLDSGDYKKPLSEMLEMRILPKLRGIELSGSIEREIEKIVILIEDRIENPDLAKKVEDSKNDGMFTWNR